jgi:DNA helicase-2/ATP-dependent DNA helicase PcrA
VIDCSRYNEQQMEAIRHGKGPCLVLATAGSGKTAVLTVRTATLIESGTHPNRILLATFTKKAGQEMRERLATLIGELRVEPMRIGTFHSHCLYMLRTTYAEQEWESFEVLPPYKCLTLARNILSEANVKNTNGMGWATDPKKVLARISRAKSELISLEKAEKIIESERGIGMLARLFSKEELGLTLDFWRRYEAIKEEHRQFDFDDFLLKLYLIFQEKPEILERWQDAFDYILEDEVQDTTNAQHTIATLLAKKHKNYFAVGDAQQSVYSFRGSDPMTTVMSFTKTYVGGKIIKLPMNYRSQQCIVDRASQLISHGNLSEQYNLRPESFRGRGEDPVVISPADEDMEAAEVVRGIVGNILDGHAYKDIAVLYRTNAQSRALEDAMIGHTIPYIVHGGCGFYGRAEVKDMIAYLQLAHDPNCEAGNEAMRRTAIGGSPLLNIASTWFMSRGESKPTHFLGKKFVETLETVATQNGCSMFQALNKHAWQPWQWEGIEDFQEMIGMIKRVGPRPAEMILEARNIGYDAFVLRDDSDEETDGDESSRIENLDELTHASHAHDNVASLLDFVTQQRSKAKQLAADQDAVQLLTIHRSKGLEWPVVYLCGVSLGLLPHRKSIEWFDPDTKRRMRPESIEEERRLCYVGVTRARDELTISAPSKYQDKDMTESPFISEMGLAVPEAEVEQVA